MHKQTVSLYMQIVLNVVRRNLDHWFLQISAMNSEYQLSVFWKDF